MFTCITDASVCAGEFVAQFKFTVLLMPNGPLRYTCMENQCVSTVLFQLLVFTYPSLPYMPCTYIYISRLHQIACALARLQITVQCFSQAMSALVTSQSTIYYVFFVSSLATIHAYLFGDVCVCLLPRITSGPMEPEAFQSSHCLEDSELKVGTLCFCST